MVMWLRGQYDFWNFTRGIGYDTSVMLWTNPVGSAGGRSDGVPEPSGVMALLVMTTATLARRRRSA